MAIISDNNDFENQNPKQKNPIIKTESIEYDKTFENSIRPKSFEDYIGQSALKETLKISIEVRLSYLISKVDNLSLILLIVLFI